MLYCFAAVVLLITSQICYVWIFEYLGGPTFKWLGLFLTERVLENVPTLLLEQPLKFIAHGNIFEKLHYKTLQHTIRDM